MPKKSPSRRATGRQQRNTRTNKERVQGLLTKFSDQRVDRGRGTEPRGIPGRVQSLRAERLARATKSKISPKPRKRPEAKKGKR